VAYFYSAAVAWFCSALDTRSEKLLIPLEKPANPDPNGAAAIQELLGGKFGEMSTLNNYLHQSFGFKEKKTTPNPRKNKK